MLLGYIVASAAAAGSLPHDVVQEGMRTKDCHKSVQHQTIVRSHPDLLTHQHQHDTDLWKGPCDIFLRTGTRCVAAHSVVRSMYV